MARSPSAHSRKGRAGEANARKCERLRRLSSPRCGDEPRASAPVVSGEARKRAHRRVGSLIARHVCYLSACSARVAGRLELLRFHFGDSRPSAHHNSQNLETFWTATAGFGALLTQVGASRRPHVRRERRRPRGGRRRALDTSLKFNHAFFNRVIHPDSPTKIMKKS